MIAIVSDSGSMLPAELRDRYGVHVVPLTVTIDGHDFSEGTGITNREFYAKLAAGAAVSTSAPAPGAFLDAYRRATANDADEIVSIHTGSTYSATVSAATLAAEMTDLDIAIVDTELASFPVALCVWAAAEAVASGATLRGVQQVAQSTAARTGSVFVVGVPELARRGGRFVAVDGALTATTVLEIDHTELRALEDVDDVDAAVDVMVEHTRRRAALTPIRVGVGDAQREDVAGVLAARLDGIAGILGVTRYEVGPSVGAHVGAGSVGVVYAPATT